MAQLTKTNEKLKKFSHVNKKALDQYLSFTTQREDLLSRKTELDEGGKVLNTVTDSKSNVPHFVSGHTKAN